MAQWDRSAHTERSGRPDTYRKRAVIPPAIALATIILATSTSAAWRQNPKEADRSDRSEEVRIKALHKAADLIGQHDFASAEKTLQVLLKQSPQDAVALNLLGFVEMQQHNREAAEKLFRQAINTGQPIVGPRINLALLQATVQPLQALTELGEALKLAPQNQQAQSLVRSIEKASSLNAMRAGEKDKALAIVLQARRALPNNPEILYDLGMVSLELGLNEDAEKAFEEALRQRPEYDEAIYGLARAYLARSHAKQAEETIRKYLRRRPEDASAYYGLGYILLAEQQLEDARAAFEKSLVLQPNQTESEFQLGEIAVEQGDQNSAREHFTKVLSRDPHHAGALTEIGVFAFRSSEYDVAKTTLKQAIASAPTYQKAHYYYALTLAKLGNKAEAEQEFDISRRLEKSHTAESHLLTPQLTHQ